MAEDADVIVVGGGLAILLALTLDLMLLGVQRILSPWRRATA